MKADNDNHALPRLMTREQAATYCACCPSTFSRWVAAGKMPRPIPGLKRWDRSAIDGNIASLAGCNDNVPDDPYLAWKAADARRT